jgi:hypothetical protein
MKSVISIFFLEFWPIFIGVSTSFCLVWFLSRKASDVRPQFSRAKTFKELSGYSNEEQKRLLHDAAALAFRYWHACIPSLIFSAFLSGGMAVAHTLIKVTVLPDSFWIVVVVAILFSFQGGCMAGKLEARYIREALRNCLEKKYDVT